MFASRSKIGICGVALLVHACFAPVSLSYSASARRGTLAVRINQNQFEKAREWVRRNIETLARDKNIALVTGEIPPGARFYLLDEELKDGNILEIEFKTE